MNEERIKEVFSDEAFVKNLFEQEEPEQVQELLAEKEIDLSVDEIIKLQEMLIKQVNGEMDMEELSDEDLEDVSGGLGALLGFVIAIGIAVTGWAGLGAAYISRRRRRW